MAWKSVRRGFRCKLMLDPSDELSAAWQELQGAQADFNMLDLSRNGLVYLNEATIADIDRSVSQLNRAHERFLIARRSLKDIR